MEYNTTLNKVIDFHGHICPGVAYGYRAAEAALKAFGKRAEDEEIVAVVENDSCAVDAIQVMTGCTFGKGNLIFKDYGKQVYSFFKRSTGEGFRVAVDYSRKESADESAVWDKYHAGERTPELLEQIQALKRRKVEEILTTPADQILSIQSARVPMPEKAQIYPTIRCEKCGEKVMEPRIEETEGKRYCIPCAAPH
jgi:formylmethanofuran dehydrogenase subunit E